MSFTTRSAGCGKYCVRRADLQIDAVNVSAHIRRMAKTGSFHHHRDWHASHCVKVMLDQIFGENNLGDNTHISWHEIMLP